MLKESARARIVHTLGVDTAHPPMLVMELMQTSLDELLQQPATRIEAATARGWMLDAALALAALHALRPHALLHRDVKPANLLVDRRDGRLKLADFGLSAWANESATLAKFCGTYCYGAPELLFAAFSSASDVYSLAIALWEVAWRVQHGVPADAHVGSGDRGQLVEAARGWRPPLVGLPHATRALLADAWHALPSRRSSAADVASALRAAD